ncbi:MAG: tetratricopeptide repeat protein, partial [Candidatus Methylomirabilales bacterium]
MRQDDRQGAPGQGQLSLPALLAELDRCKAGGDAPGTGWALAKIGTVYQTQGKHRQALAVFQESL